MTTSALTAADHANILELDTETFIGLCEVMPELRQARMQGGEDCRGIGWGPRGRKPAGIRYLLGDHGYAKFVEGKCVGHVHTAEARAWCLGYDEANR